VSAGTAGPLSTVTVTLRGAAVIAAASVALAACGGGADGSPPGATTRGDSACLPGMTALAPRTLGHGLFSALAWNGGALLATGSADLQQFPLTGDPASSLTQGDDLRGLVVVGASVYFSADHVVGAPNAEGKQSSTSALYSAPLAGGAPTLTVDTPLDVDGAVTDGTALYFKGYGVGITRVAIADGARTLLPLSTSLSVNAIALAGGVLYVAATDLGSTSATNGVIVKLPTDGGAAAQTVVADIGHPWSLVADPTGLSWVEDPPTGDFGDPGRVVHSRLDGGGMKTLLDHPARALAVSDGDLFVAWDSISKVPLAGGAETILVPGLTAPGLLTIAAGNAAWVDPVSQAKSDPTVPALMTTCW
jgi:hypothetical protein